jgi:D-alanyl-lipoteichoic acid acyltransferase DltB (MBOAT superfamily)
MLFNSHVFILAFLPVVLVLYYLVADHHRLRQVVLIVASLFFYAYWSVAALPLLVGLTLANWGIIQVYGRGGGRYWPWLGLGLNFAVLGVFKYANFFAAQVDAVVGRVHTPWDIILPLGISFFVFQKISYLVDLARGDRRIYGFLDFFTFVTFFPQLIAGPIVRHNEIVGQFEASPRGPEMWENLSRGAVLFVIGLTKKTGIADTMAAVCDPLFHAASAAPLNGAAAWAAVSSFTLQIYYDFSGYSDMAIGLALMFGLRLPFNFDAPYRATSIRDFWRRWHITLSRLLRDYLYIPLGGNRAGAARQAANVVVTMLLGGLWHGANWTFVAWGGLHGVALAVNGAWQRRGWPMPAPLGWALTLLFVMVAWVLFRSPSFTIAADMIGSMAGLHGWGRAPFDNLDVAAAAALAAIVGPTSQRFALSALRPRRWLAIPAAISLVYMLLLIGGRAQHEFIYFQF